VIIYRLRAVGIHGDQIMLRRQPSRRFASRSFGKGFRFSSAMRRHRLMVDRKSRRLLAATPRNWPPIARSPPVPTLKHPGLNALLERGRLHAGDTFTAPETPTPGAHSRARIAPARTLTVRYTPSPITAMLRGAPTSPRDLTPANSPPDRKWGMLSRTKLFGNGKPRPRMERAPT